MFRKFQADAGKYGRTFLPIILTVLFGMQIMRVLLLSFVGYLRDSLNTAPFDIAPFAVGIFALSLLAVLINRFLGTRNALLLTSGGLAIMRLIEQFIDDPSRDYIISAIGVVLFLAYIPIALGSARAQSGAASRHFAQAFLLGLSLDSAIFIAGNTLDLSWQSGFFAIGIVFILVGIHLSLLNNYVAAAKAATDISWKSAIAYLAFGPWLFLQSLLFQNTGLFGSLSAFAIPAAGFALLLSNALALYLLPRITTIFKNDLYLLVAFASFAAILFVLPQTTSFVAIALLMLGQISSFALLFGLFQLASAKQSAPGLAATSTMMGIGQILFILFLFIYYTAYVIDFGIRSEILLPVAAVVMLLGFLPARASISASVSFSSSKSVAITALLLLVFPLIKMISSSTPPELSPTGNQVRVMTYNLHNAVNTSGRLDPETLALIIEESGAEIVGFQEISRGWLTWGGLDMLSWFADRLDMYYVWGPTVDAQWGNALFSRYPISDYEVFDLPPNDLLLLRGYINATIDLGSHSLNIIDTHFSDLSDQGPERLLQSSALLSTWNQRAFTIIMGDLNAGPQSEEFRLLIDNGMVDISAEIGIPPTFTYYADNPDHQIDYILASPDLGFSDFVIMRTSASDHLPVISTLHFDQ